MSEEKPLTREDVLKLIKENGGKAEGIDLSDKVFEPGINLQGLDLHGITLNGSVFPLTTSEEVLEKTLLSGAQLQNANLQMAQLQYVSLSSANLQQANLTLSNLHKAQLTMSNLKESKLLGINCQETDLTGVNISGANIGGIITQFGLQIANLQKADLKGATIYKTTLNGADLRGADLRYANMREAKIQQIDVSRDTRFENVQWGNYILGAERELDEENRGSLDTIEEPYRRLKQWYTEAGMYDVAGAFHYREMTVRRKLKRRLLKEPPFAEISWFTKKSREMKRFIEWLLLCLYWLLCGYGEKPERVVISAIAVVLGGGSIYIAGAQSPQMAYYFSAVSFTALGYGAWINSSSIETWVKALGACEAFIGVFMMALFLVTFTRKMTR